MPETSTTIESDRVTFSAEIKAEAMRLGFDLAGIAPAVTPSGFDQLQMWLQRGYAGAMNYLPRREAAYQHPRHVMDGVRSLVILAINYRTIEPPQPAPMQGVVSRYAWSELDYHEFIRGKLKQLSDFVHCHRPGCRTRGAVDTAPLLERDFARLAGLGWFGKNTMLINKRVGSWLFLAALLTDLELEYDEPHQSAHCGTCTLCLEACPTDAFPEPYVLDPRKCISYLTIELHDAPIPIELRERTGQWLFGCDICQDVCPWNRKAPIAQEAAFKPTHDLAPADAVALLKMSEDDFQKRFRNSPLKRPGRPGLLRNAAIVLGNSGDPRAVPALVDALNDVEPIIRGAAAWALGRLRGANAASALQSRLSVENNAGVITEIENALEFLADKTAWKD